MYTNLEKLRAHLEKLKASSRFTKKAIMEAEKNLERMKAAYRFDKRMIKDIEDEIKKLEAAEGPIKSETKQTKDHAKFELHGEGIPMQFSQIVFKAIFELAKSKSLADLRHNLPSSVILESSESHQRRMFATPDELTTFTDDYQKRYFRDIITDKDGVKFYLWSNWGRYVVQRNGERKEGNIYKAIRELKEKFDIIITQVEGGNYSQAA